MASHLGDRLEPVGFRLKMPRTDSEAWVLERFAVARSDRTLVFEFDDLADTHWREDHPAEILDCAFEDLHEWVSYWESWPFLSMSEQPARVVSDEIPPVVAEFFRGGDKLAGTRLAEFQSVVAPWLEDHGHRVMIGDLGVTATTVVDLAERVTTAVQQGAQKERIAEQVTQLKRIEESVSQLYTIVESTVTLVSAALDAGVDVPIAGLRQAATELKAISTRAAKGEVDGSAVDRVVIEVRSQITSIQAAVSVEWRELVDRKVPQREGLARLADTFRQLDASSPLAAELRNALASARDLASGTPSLAALTSLETIARRVPELLRDLFGDDPNVRTFADELARGGARLDALTPEVVSWIRSRGFDRSFKVVPGEPA